MPKKVDVTDLEIKYNFRVMSLTNNTVFSFNSPKQALNFFKTYMKRINSKFVGEAELGSRDFDLNTFENYFHILFTKDFDFKKAYNENPVMMTPKKMRVKSDDVFNSVLGFIDKNLADKYTEKTELVPLSLRIEEFNNLMDSIMENTDYVSDILYFHFFISGYDKKNNIETILFPIERTN